MSTQERTIVDENGEEYDPIPFGEEDSFQTYSELIENFEHEIKTGGRGKLGAEQVREQMEAFKDMYSEEEYDNRSCHDCAAEMGEPHMAGCDMEQCPICRSQYLSCACRTNEDDSTLMSQDWFDPEDPAGSLREAQRDN